MMSKLAVKQFLHNNRIHHQKQVFSAHCAVHTTIVPAQTAGGYCRLSTKDS